MQTEKLIARINQQLLKGELPIELDFSEREPEIIDYDKIKYQAFYKTFEYASSKFPAGFAECDYLRPVIEASIPQHSPLDEMLQRQYECSNDEELKAEAKE